MMNDAVIAGTCSANSCLIGSSFASVNTGNSLKNVWQQLSFLQGPNIATASTFDEAEP